MCDKCSDINQAIARYKLLKKQTADLLATRAADELVIRLEAQKLALHPKN